MFPGGGAQYAGMARDLYETEPVFADWMDRGLDHLQKQLDYDIRALWLPEAGGEDAANERLKQPSVQLPLIMILEYALAQLWISWGVRPAALVGHSMGENTAACLAGVMAFEDCIDLVLLRGRLFDAVPEGGMLSIALPLADVEELIGDDLDIASVNAPELTAVSGPKSALNRLSQLLTEREVEHQPIRIDIAAHSRMLDPILQKYGDFLAKIQLHPPKIAIMSNRTGTALTPEQATNPAYWTGQLRNTVMFADCISTLSTNPERVFLEVGPGKALSALAGMHPEISPGQVLSSLRHPDQDIADDACFLGVIGRLWACGVEADWDQIWGEARRNRLPLPTYAFQRSRYFIEPGQAVASAETAAPERADAIADWGYRPVWRPKLADCALDVTLDLSEAPLSWLVFEDETGFAAPALTRLEEAGHHITRVRTGDTYARLDDGSYLIAPEQGLPGYEALLQDLEQSGHLPDRIAHFWLVTERESFRPGASFFDRNLETGFYSLTHIAQALASVDNDLAPHIEIFTNGAARTGNEPLRYPEKAMVSGPAGVIPREFPGVTCAWTDIELARRATGLMARLRGAIPPDLTTRLLEELLADPSSRTAAWRGDRRLELDWRAMSLPEADNPVFRPGGTYLITGGHGGIGQTLATHLLREYGANVALVSREELPPRDQWSRFLRSHSPANRTVQRIQAVLALEDIGNGRVLPLAADVCNSDQMQAAVEKIHAEFGALHGVLHGAGDISDGPILAKTEADIARVFAPKVSGLRVLDALFPDGSIELMVLFSSSSTVTRPAGQVDYVAANEYLNAYAAHRQGDQTRVVAIDWGVWADTGMTAEAMAARHRDGDPMQRIPCEQPLLDDSGFDAGGCPFFVSRFSSDDWIMDEHRLADGTALMPGTGYVELLAQALRAQGIENGFEIRDLYFLRPLVAATAAAETVVRLVPSPDGYDFTVHSTLSGGGYAINAQGQILLEDMRSRQFDVEAASARCPDIPEFPACERLRSPQEAHLNFGQRWHVLDHMALGQGEGFARLSLPEIAAQDGCLLHPGLMDLATGWAISLVPDYRGQTLWVPVSYGRLCVHAPLTGSICSHVRLNPMSDSGVALFDITLSDPQGRVLVEIERFQMKRLDGLLDLSPPAKPDATAEDLGLTRSETRQPLSPEERRLHHNIGKGIRREEGPEALIRALATGRSQVVISSLDLPALVAQAAQSGAPRQQSEQSFERPQLDTDFVAPRNPTEQALADQFASLLGVSGVGIDDSFFDLGGHSLVAVRLFSWIKRHFDVEFPISVLFEAPSIAALAELIIQQTGGGISNEPSPANGDTATGQEAPRFTHLVKLHPGDGTGRRPFFLVAGMFGNVLNLRQLALLVGRDRPVYGLQARGLIGSDEPHCDMREAARDYLTEIRSIQPEGPYHLGGFSGGGITAYEMARQLQENGQQVASLVLLDTPLPERPLLNRRDRLLIKMHEIRSKGLRYLTEWAGNRIRWEIEKRQPAQAETGTVPEFNNRKIELAFRHAAATYSLERWDGPVTLFRPPLDRHWQVSEGNWVSREREYVFADNDWTRWAPQVQVVEVPGDHDSMVLVPNVSTLADQVRRVLDASEPDPRTAFRTGPGQITTAAE